MTNEETFKEINRIFQQQVSPLLEKTSRAMVVIVDLDKLPDGTGYDMTASVISHTNHKGDLLRIANCAVQAIENM